MRRLGRWLVAVAVCLLARRSEGPDRGSERERIVPPGPPAPRAELVVVGLLLLAALSAARVHRRLRARPHRATRPSSSASALGLGVRLPRRGPDRRPAGTWSSPRSSRSDVPADPEHRRGGASSCSSSRRAAAASPAAGSSAVARRSRRRRARAGAARAGCCRSARRSTWSRSRATPWRRGRRLVDEDGPAARRARRSTSKTFYTAFPEGADPEQLGAPLVVVRLAPARLQLPPDRRGWAPERDPRLLEDLHARRLRDRALPRAALRSRSSRSRRSSAPATTRRSTRRPAARSLFGPAGRPLPQLPLEIDADGQPARRRELRGPVGPSWWGVRDRKATP